VLNRLTSLSNTVNTIGSKGDISSRVSVKGKDELSGLADNINNMLDSLQKSEAGRQSQKEVISHINKNTPNGVLAIDNSDRIILFNETFRNMLGLKNGDIIGSKLDELPVLSRIAMEIKRFKESRSSNLTKELQYLRNGLNRIYIANFARLTEEELYILYLTDISDERARQENLYLTDRLASIGEMASGIAHELNNPLTSIIGLSEIVSREDIPESIQEDMSLIKSESHRAAGIVRNLLSFARKSATVKQPAYINKIVLDVIRLRSYEHGVNNIKAIQELDPRLPEIMIDYSQIQQVFINIILNAEHAMVQAHGKGTLIVKTEQADKMVRISFIDDGPGIEPQNLRRIFDPFFTTKEPGKGTGLGLSISYGIVTAHKGQIYAKSEFGKGATFVIELPLHYTDTKETKQDAQ
jgi:signal transduction histidine kinase